MPIQFITPSIISSVANTQVTGTITASQIATVNANTITSGSIPVAQIPQLTTAKMPTGSVLQVVQSIKTSAQSTTSTSYVDITDLSVSITPTSSSSKILVMARINNISNSLDYGTFINLLRNSTTITSSTAGGVADTKDAWAGGGGGMGGTGNSRQKSSCAIDYLDSPATTSATTYKMQMVADSGSTATVNQWALNTDVASVSSITVMEIAA